MIMIQKPLNVKSNKEKIDMLTFKQLISEAQSNKHIIVDQLYNKLKNASSEYEYYSVIIHLSPNNLAFIVDYETDNAFIDGFTIKLFSTCKYDYHQSLTKESIMNDFENALSDFEILCSNPFID